MYYYKDELKRGENSLRRLFHSIAGIVLVFTLSQADKTSGIFIVSSLFAMIIITETLRLRLPAVNSLFFRYLNPLLRQEEKRQPTGTIYFLGGVLLSLLLFDWEIALFSITILSVGDPAASTIGKISGRYRIGRKSLEGSAAFFIASIAAGLILRGLWPGLPAGAMITGVTVGTLVELIPSKVNDNLLIPVASGGAMEVYLLSLHLV